FRQADAKLYGLEAEGFIDVTNTLRVSLFGDYIRAKIDSEDLPRIPPLRLGSTLSYQDESISADVSVTWYDEQDKVASYETTTDSYTMLDASVEYIIPGNYEWSVYARANNLLDEEARVHTSFIKDQAPLPGRNFTVGTRLVF
ncbi:MAG: TonB-dependent receptor, partial [Aestuariibacter sp.]|nr:TonB-dependent receptor [Aestuariibacter sp.]